MKLNELVKHLQSEQTAEEYLREKGIIKTFGECIYCGSKNMQDQKEFLSMLQMQEVIQQSQRVDTGKLKNKL